MCKNSRTAEDSMIIVEDFKGRKLTLLSRIAKKTNGHRYITRNSVAAVILGTAHRVRGGSKAINPKKEWPAKASNSRIKIGCHIFTGNNFQAIFNWAINR